MSDSDRWEDWYELLGVPSNAPNNVVRGAWRSAAKETHPDQFRQQPKWVRDDASQRFQRFQRAWEVLGDPELRRAYDQEWRSRNTPPAPKVDPPAITLTDTGTNISTMFEVRNIGGSYSRIWISQPDSWLRISSVESLETDDELPLRVILTASIPRTGPRLEERIEVRLDDRETVVTVVAPERREPARSNAGRAPTTQQHRAPGTNVLCPSCGRSNGAGLIYCTYDGCHAILRVATRICDWCRHRIPYNARYCPDCGER